MAGGRMAVYTGLIEKLQLTDDELAQIMGHEISHALANHTAEKMSVAIATQLGVTAIAVATDASDRTLTAGAIAAQLAVQLPNSRTAETESDRMGIELAARAGYDPRAAVTLWQKMAKVSGNGPPQFLSTHPAPGNRQKTLSNLVPQMQKLRPAKLVPVTPITLAK
jgi:predicted Zn-dependent protease